MESLPVEIVSKIIDYLTPHEQVQLQCVSKRFFGLARDNALWRLHCYEESWVAAQKLRPAISATGSLVTNSAASLSSLGQTSLRSLIQPHIDRSNETHDSLQGPSFGERSRAAAAWDPSYEGEDVDWYSEYIARNAPISFNWLQQPYIRDPQTKKRDNREVKGIGLLRDWSSARQNKAIAPLDDGSVCIWDLNHSHSIGSDTTKGQVLGVSAPGILVTDLSRRKMNLTSKSQLEFINLGECVSVDSMRGRAYLAVGNVLNEVDLENLRVISQQRYPWSIFALSQETDYSVPLTLATTLSLHIYDARMSATEEEEAINLRCEKPTVSLVPESQLYAPPDSPLLQLQANGRPPHRIRSPGPSEHYDNYAPLFQPGPLSLLHPPAPHVNSIFLAGRFPSILQYDRRFFPRLQGTIHSGGRLCGLASAPAPQFPSAARSKVLSAESHGTRIVYSDAEGNIKWVERDGRSEVRRFNLNAYKPRPGRRESSERNADGQEHEDHRVRGLWNSASREDGDVARKILPTGGNLSGDELLVWTGERVGRLKFSDSVDIDGELDEDDDMSIDADGDDSEREELRNQRREHQRREREYSRMMRRALERQADEVRRMGDLGL
ncbi:hypothetical protein FE257_000654 [Aspergillus nanangensis]|uniref:F-box domain-containing protein n=1 Tax=Aspergillus nanangensis TaxID=2582783 RepID=A0AAD4CFA1_ASPNN|nr:hypothetical protein FE257_000654 [Aspergillus nanangensis]